MDKIRYNKEYFGYIVGYPDGNIFLAKDSILPFLDKNTHVDKIKPHLLEEIEVPHGFFLNSPLLVWAELTRKCNLTCPHCYIDAGEKRENEMNGNEWKFLIDEMAEMGVWGIAFTGGEPTMHPDFIEIVNYAAKRDLLIGIATNGLFLTESNLNLLPKSNTIISISLDDLHFSNSNTSDFNSVVKTIKRCQVHNFNTNVMVNTNRLNVDKLDEIIKWAELNNVSVRSVPFSPIGSRAKKNIYLQNKVEDVNKSAEFWLKECVWEHKFHEKVGLCVGLIFNYGLTMAYMTNRCSSGRYLCYISADGTTYPCTMCAGENILSPGNVRDQGFKNLWRSKWSIREYSWKDFKNTCEGCVLDNDNYFCTSRCPAMSHARHGKYNLCGASDYEKLSVLVRTHLLNSTKFGISENKSD